MGYPLRKTMALAGLVLSAAFLAGCGRNPAGPDPAAAAAESSDHAPSNQPAHRAMTPGEGTAAAPETVPNQVVIDNFAFQPATLTVKAGTKVTWVNRDDVPHTATSTARPKRFDSRTLDTDDQFSHVFTAPGTYEYFCAVHPNMTGRVIVK